MMKKIEIKPILFFLLSCFLLSWINVGQANSFGTRKKVRDFIQEMAAQHQFDSKKLTRLFNTVKERKKVIAKIKHPYEGEVPWFEYRKLFLDKERIQQGVAFWKKYKKELAQAEYKYGVPASIIVAIIGVESKYGENLGEFHVFNTLSNLAFNYSPRSAFFRNELIEFLLFCRERNIDPRTPLGSYAGAIGQPQFMPSSFRRYAVDFSHSGKIDLTYDDIDVIGSIANYLKESGWKRGERIRIPARRNRKRVNHLSVNVLEEKYTQKQLADNGVLPLVKINRDIRFGIIKLLDKHGTKYWLGLHNMYVITRYNVHIQYAMAVYDLSREISNLYFKTTNHPMRVNRHKQKL